MKYLLMAILVLSTFVVRAQSIDVRAAVLDYVEGFYEGDTVKLKRSVASSLFKYGYWRDKRNKYTGEQMTFRQAVDYAKRVLTKKRFAKSDAPKNVVILDEEEAVAAAKVTAWWSI